MKNRLLLVFAFLVLTGVVNGQPDSLGIYLTTQDYLIKKLSYKVSCRDKQNSSISRSFVSGLKKQEKYHLEKSTWFGFHDCKLGDHRFYKRSEYRILHFSDDLILYSKKVLRPQGKFVVTETAYFFSRGIESSIFTLEKKSLKQVFPEKKSFHDRLDELFQGDDSLIHFDKIKKEYKLIEVYNLSKDNS
jgi:hypothetical protein